MARKRHDRRHRPTTETIDTLGLRKTGWIAPAHRSDTRRSWRRGVLVGALSLAMLLGLGLAMTARAERADPAASQSRYDGERASRDAARPDRADRAARPDRAALGAVGARAPGSSPDRRASIGRLPRRPAATTATPPKAPPASPSTSAQAPAPSGQRSIQAYLTGYSYFDNTPPGSAEISHPILHQTAGGTGTYADPITLAVGHSIVNGRDLLDWPAGTRFYVPNLRRYFIAEDTCGDGSSPQDGACHVGYPATATSWLDLWIGGEGGTADGADSCMNSITDVWTVLVNPPSTYPTDAGSVYGAAGCTRQFGNSAVSG